MARNPIERESEHFASDINAMFDAIAPTYDRLNRVNSWGLDQRWRRRLVKRIARTEPRRILDLASGTGDLAIMLAERCEGTTVVASDMSKGMLAHAQRKFDECGLDQIEIQIADALHLPFEDESFDAVTCSFGVRNFDDILRAYEEMARVLRPGGIVGILELTTPATPVMKGFHHLYSHAIIPSIAKLVGKGDEYKYLAESIEEVPQRSDMTVLMRAAGLQDARFRVFFPPACAMYTARK